MLLQECRRICRPLQFLSRGLPLVATSAVVCFLLGWAVWNFVPLSPRARLPAKSEIVRLSPDGRLLATRQSGQVKLWDVASGKESGALSGDLARWPIWGFAFSPDGRWLVGSGEGFLKIWEVPAGREETAIQVSTDPKFRPRPAFSAEGKWLAFRAQGEKQQDEVRIWDLSERRERVVLPGRTGPLRFSPDGKMLAFESRTGESSQAGNAQSRGEIGDGESPVLGVIRLWDVVSGKERAALESQPQPLRRLAFSPDGRTVAAGERKRPKWPGPYKLKLWDVAAGQTRGPWQLPWPVNGLRFTADGSRILVTSLLDAWHLAVIDPAAPPGEVTPASMGNSFSYSISADGKLLATSPNQPDHAATIFSLPELRELAHLKPRHRGERLFLHDFTRDGKLLAVLAGWNEAPSRRSRFLASKTASPNEAQFSHLLDGELHVYATHTGAHQGTVPVVRSAPSWFTPDGSTLVVLAPEGTPTIWDIPLPTSWSFILGSWAVLAVCFALSVLIAVRRRGSAGEGERLRAGL